MDISPRAATQILLTRLPVLIATVILACFGHSPNGEHQDLLTELITILARPILGTPASLSNSQRAFNRDYGVWGRMWVSKWTVQVPTTSTNRDGQVATGNVTHGRDLGTGQPLKDNCKAKSMTLPEAVHFAIRELANEKDDRLCQDEMPPLKPVEVEWTAYRAKAFFPFSPRPSTSEHDMYRAMMDEIGSSGPTILYLHGGAHCLMDPVTHRWSTTRLAKESGGRVLAVRYRLSPQHMFPASLLDALSVYMALICPPPGSYHTAVSASQIVIAGDSSGAGLAAALVLLLQTLSNHRVAPRWYSSTDTNIPDPVCAGLALVSPWLDITRCLPSTAANARWDIIAPPPAPGLNPTPAFPPDDIWPAHPPRVETYCKAAMCAHPLVSPLAAQSHHWKGIPPVYVCVGWEGMQDEAEVFARRVIEADPENQVVIFDGYEGMPHCFAMFPWNWAGTTAMRRWAEFCSDVVRSGPRWVLRPVASTGTWTSNRKRHVRQVPLKDLGLKEDRPGRLENQLDDLHVNERLAEARRWRIELDNQMAAGPKHHPALRGLDLPLSHHEKQIDVTIDTWRDR
ncbi:hypothetical protein LTS17_002531 [Exophiala oligosperma]